jgi:hypothetical protein
MKKTMYTWMGFLMAASLFSCQQKSNPNFEQGSFAVTHESRHLDISFKHSKDNASYLEVTDLQDEQKLLSLVNSEFAYENKTTYTKLMDYHIKEGKEKSYLIFQAYSINTQKISAVAYGIQLNSDRSHATFITNKPAVSNNGRALLAVAASDGHTCTGAPCSCCKFVEEDGAVIGCDCKDQSLSPIANCFSEKKERGCNHTNSGGGTGGGGTGGGTPGTVPHYAQCGGAGYTGPTVCQSPYTCTVMNAWYSQCL